MKSNIGIGFSLYPRWFEGVGLEKFLAPLRSAGLTAIEFELDDNLDCWPELLALMEAAYELGLELSFHAPYKPPHRLLGFAGNQRRSLELHFEPLWAVAEGWAQQMGSACTVVAHPAVSKTPIDPATLVDDTVAYLGWALETFPHVNIALENLHPPKGQEIKIGIEREELIEIINRIPSDRLGICWDMGHDFLRHVQDQPSSEWLSKIMHVHIHDVDQYDKDHYPLILGNVPYYGWLKSLRKAGMNGIVVLELKGERLMGWSWDQVDAALISSIEKIAQEI